MAEEYEGLRGLWIETGDPRWVWRAIQSTVHCGDGDIPAWVLNYLVDVVAGIEDAGGAAGRELHRILKFPAKSGPWRGPSRMMQIERFGVEFIRQVLGGQNAEQGARRSGTP